MAKLPDDFPSIEEQALPWPTKAEEPTDQERKTFTAARLELLSLINRDFDRRMTATVKLIAGFLLESVNSETLRCFPSYRTILETLCVVKSEKTIERAIAVLRERGWIYSWRPDRTKSNHFVFLKNEQVVSQILNYQDYVRGLREEDRLERERTRMSVREGGTGMQMSVREQTSVSGKSFNVIHEPISSIEKEGDLIEANPYAARSSGDGDMQRLPIPNDDREAESMLDAICADMPEADYIRGHLKFLLIAGALTKRKVLKMVAEQRRAAA
ncbi:helix-turn-helix domain-containing protein [Sinorhizobium meliloti]|uniref:helix-turn-helix domain-containing protein n=1 Tax=Rhizobium meliloti TaxID=382 RepID=UPI00031D8BE3|nr:helix-turn-helix domain-containing protein [Sinorhizobium meliloti]MDX1070505.1 helix-turn-helix domain-containing protein [Sinorhizobium medicae]ATB03600.1 helix-turn-helix domain-containing protein [Sinorhizobium meliloti]MDE3872985.1 helix-turn-helix domain-containing protein [Sinorhizobium meliloti]RVH32360.1 helix-turn-helix domain-containing protein [Sinorhizobium meliloti]RVN63770.1 helix-turn-helix domain-containing protein [Sinorhizobium meliloti]